MTGTEINSPEVPLEIRITVDKEAKTITIQDTGIGLSEEDMVRVVSIAYSRLDLSDCCLCVGVLFVFS